MDILVRINVNYVLKEPWFFLKEQERKKSKNNKTDQKIRRKRN